MQYVVVLVKIMEKLWGRDGWGRCIVLLAVALVNCKSKLFKALWKFVQFDKLHEDLNFILPVNCVPG